MFWLCTCESVKKLSVTTTSWVDFFIKALGGRGPCLSRSNQRGSRMRASGRAPNGAWRGWWRYGTGRLINERERETERVAREREGDGRVAFRCRLLQSPELP